MPETESLDGIRRELLRSYQDDEARERLRDLLRIVREIFEHSSFPLEDLLSEQPSIHSDLAGLPDRHSPDGRSRQLAFDFRRSAGRRKSKNRTEEQRGEYARSLPATAAEDLPLNELCELTRSRLARHFWRGDVLSSPETVKRYLMTRLALLESEVFAAVFLDTRHQILAFEELFRGTIDECIVHPREIVRRTLHHNASSLILAHNHPSGIACISQADKDLTRKVKDALALIDVWVLDHIVIGGSEAMSFKEEGLI